MLKYEPFFPEKKAALLPNSFETTSNLSQILEDFSGFALSKEAVHDQSKLSLNQSETSRTMIAILSEKTNAGKKNIDLSNREKSEKESSPVSQSVADFAETDREAFSKEQNQNEKQREVDEVKKEAAIQIEGMKKKHELEIKALRESITEIVKNLEKGFQEGLRKIEADVSYQTTEILADFVKEKFIDTTLHEFAENLAAETLHRQKPIIIEGNKELLENLAVFLEDKTYYQFKPTEDHEIRVIGISAWGESINDNTVLSTRLVPWLRQLEELSK